MNNDAMTEVIDRLKGVKFHLLGCFSLGEAECNKYGVAMEYMFYCVSGHLYAAEWRRDFSKAGAAVDFDFYKSIKQMSRQTRNSRDVVPFDKLPEQVRMAVLLDADKLVVPELATVKDPGFIDACRAQGVVPGVYDSLQLIGETNTSHWEVNDKGMIEFVLSSQATRYYAVYTGDTIVGYVVEEWDTYPRWCRKATGLIVQPAEMKEMQRTIKRRLEADAKCTRAVRKVARKRRQEIGRLSKKFDVPLVIADILGQDESLYRGLIEATPQIVEAMSQKSGPDFAWHIRHCGIFTRRQFITECLGTELSRQIGVDNLGKTQVRAFVRYLCKLETPPLQ